MRSFYQAHAILKSRERTDATLLAYHLVRAAHAVCEVLQRAADEYCADNGSGVDAFENILNAVARSTQSLLVGHSRLSNVSDGSQVQGHFTYAFVQIFEKCTAIVGESAKQEAQKTLLQASTNHQVANRPSTAKSRVKDSAQAPKRNKDPLAAVCSLIVSIVEKLDAKTDGHKVLFEGLVYVLVEKLGACLHTLVFGHARRSSIEEEIAYGDQTDEIEDNEKGTLPTAEAIEVKAAKLEAPYLAELLRRLMHKVPEHFGMSVANKTSKSKSNGKDVVTKNNIAITARERLQRTLLNAIFGMEDANEDDPFVDCLRRPALSTSPLPVPTVKETEVQEWFKEEVWRLLGWDILSREDA